MIVLYLNSRNTTSSFPQPGFLVLFLVPRQLWDATCVTETNYVWDRDNYRGKMKRAGFMVSLLRCKLSANFAFRHRT